MWERFNLPFMSPYIRHMSSSNEKRVKETHPTHYEHGYRGTRDEEDE